MSEVKIDIAALRVTTYILTTKPSVDRYAVTESQVVIADTAQ